MAQEYENKYDLKAPDGKAFDGFGFSMGVSDDGSVIVASAPYAAVNRKPHVGKIYIYSRRSCQVIQSVFSIAHQCFGQQLALSGDGRVIAATVLHHTELGEPLYRICMFEYGIGGCRFTQAINMDCMDEFSGITQLALDYTGSHLAVSQSIHTFCGNPDHGIVRLYEQYGDLYFSSGLLVPDENNDYVHEFGTSLKFNKNGTIIAVGASSHDGRRSGEGGVYIFATNALSGHRYSTFISPPPELNVTGFGTNIDISNDGTYLAATSWTTKENALKAVVGVHFYRLAYRDEQNVIEPQHDISLIPKHDLFGFGVALTGDGVRCAILGFNKAHPELIQQGGVFVIDLTGESKTGAVYKAAVDDTADTSIRLTMARNGSLILRGQTSFNIADKESVGLIQVFMRNELPAPVKNDLKIGYTLVQYTNGINNND